MWTHWPVTTLIVLLAAVVIYDLLQKKHAILRNFPIIGHFRYLLEMVGPELRQYIVTNNDEERPFSRDQRRWVYASAKKQNNYFGFGTDNDLEGASHYLIIKHSAFPLSAPHPGEAGYDADYHIPCAKVLGAARQRRHAFRPRSIINISAMSFGSLSANAVQAINSGCALALCLHNTGEGGIAEHHRHGGELIYQIGTGYFGCRDQAGRFDMQRLKDAVAENPVRAIEIKLSQGAKPGLGGVLPAAKVTPQIAQIRGIPAGRDCISPPAHSAFRDVDSMLDFVEHIAHETGLPVGIKSAVGNGTFWSDLAEQMAKTNRGVDYVAIDGGEGGTGAAPLVFSDHVALPFKVGFVRVYAEFLKRGLHHDVVFFGAGRLGFPEESAMAMALGCDLIYVAREAMLSIGCIQAQRCHTGHCPAGVATQNKWLMRGLAPTDKAARLANYVMTLRKELLQLARVCGVQHPALITLDDCEILDQQYQSRSLRKIFQLEQNGDWGLPSPEQLAELLAMLAAQPVEP